MSSPTVFVTGGTGFVGREIVTKVREAHPSWQICVFDLAVPTGPEPGIHYIRGDVTSFESVSNALQSVKPNAVIHTAGIVPPLPKRYTRDFRATVFKINVEGTRITLAACQAVGTVKAFVWTGSCCCVIDDFRYQYPNYDETWLPSDTGTIYGESKTASEALVLAANKPEFKTCSIRPSTLFGDTDSQLIMGIHAMIPAKETAFVLGDGMNLWDVCHASNIADAHILALDNLLVGPGTAAGEAFLIDNQEPIPFRTFCLAVWRQFDHYPPYQIHIPESLGWWLGYLAEWASWLSGRDPGISRGSIADATAWRYANPDKARKILGYKPRISLDEGIRRSCQVWTCFVLDRP